MEYGFAWLGEFVDESEETERDGQMENRANGFVGPVGEAEEAGLGKEESDCTENVGHDAEQGREGQKEKELLTGESAHRRQGAAEVGGEPKHAQSRTRRINSDFCPLEKEESSFPRDRELKQIEKPFCTNGDREPDGPAQVEIE